MANLRITLLAISIFAGSTAWSQHPEWIACVPLQQRSGEFTGPEANLSEGCFRTTIQISGIVTSAIAYPIGDGCFLDVFLDGEHVAALEPFENLRALDWTNRLPVGAHTIGLQVRRAHSDDQDAPRGNAVLSCAASFEMQLKFADGSTRVIVSDSSWKRAHKPSADWRLPATDISSWPPATSLGRIDERFRARGITIDAAENYDQWKLARSGDEGGTTAKFQMTEGYSIEPIRVAEEDEDSWVSMAFDPQGRLVIAKEQVGLLRMTFDAGGKVAQVTSVNDDMFECRGLQFIGNDLYVNANNSKGLYRLQANDEDGFDEPELLYKSAGGVGHGRNDLALSPDGMIYSIHGDSVRLPQECVDLTSSYREANNGVTTSEGHLLKIDPKSGDVTIVAAGLRNPFGIDVNDAGDCFTYDADAEYDMGAPWYRPTRVHHLAAGNDYGWRGVTKQWPPYFPDHADNGPAGIDIGKGSPTAVKFGTRSNFPPRFRECLFVLDWTYGRVLAVHTLPLGSSYRMTAETFLQGRPLNVTDLDFAPDGSMYLITGGRKTQSALYRVRCTKKMPVEKAKAMPRKIYREQHAARSRIRLREIQQRTSLASADESLDRLPAELGSEDPVLRSAARNLLERTDLDVWKQLALAEADSKKALSALLSLSRHPSADSRAQILARACELPWQSLGRSWRDTALHTIERSLDKSELTEKLRVQLRQRLRKLYPDQDFGINRRLGQLLVLLEEPSVVGTTLSLAEASSDQRLHMQCLFVLRNVTQGWTLADRERYFRLLAGTRDYIGGQGMNDFLTKIRAEAIDTLSSEERKTLASLIEPVADLDRPELASSERDLVEHWTLKKLTAALSSIPRGDPARGQKIFDEGACVHCHRSGGRGRLIGPDLSSVQRRFGRSDLLGAVLDPSKVIAEKYRSIQVITIDGRAIEGQVALGGDYRSTKLRLATNMNDPYEITEIEKQDIDITKPSTKSWMPEGLLDTFTAAEIADLLAYLGVE